MGVCPSELQQKQKKKPRTYITSQSVRIWSLYLSRAHYRQLEWSRVVRIVHLFRTWRGSMSYACCSSNMIHVLSHRKVDRGVARVTLQVRRLMNVATPSIWSTCQHERTRINQVAQVSETSLSTGWLEWVSCVHAFSASISLTWSKLPVVTTSCSHCGSLSLKIRAGNFNPTST